MSVIDIVQQHLGPNEVQQISQHLDIDPATAERAVQAAVPIIVAGMAGHAQSSQGSESIQGLLGAHGGILGSLGSILAAGAPADGGILGGVLGRHSDDVGQEVQRSTGLDAAKTRQLLMILAPIVLGALARRRQQAATTQVPGVDQQAAQTPGLDQELKQEAQIAREKSPGVGGLLGKILSHVETPR